VLKDTKRGEGKTELREGKEKQNIVAPTGTEHVRKIDE